MDIIEGDPFRFENGALAVSDKPGLGVSINQEKLAKLPRSTRALASASATAAYAQEFDPTYERRVPRW